jgi:hypothetical protein
MAQFSSDDMALLESSVASNFEDALIIGSLSKLQQHQLNISERLNSLLADNVIKSQQPPSQPLPKPTSTPLKAPSKKSADSK